MILHVWSRIFRSCVLKHTSMNLGGYNVTQNSDFRKNRLPSSYTFYAAAYTDFRKANTVC